MARDAAPERLTIGDDLRKAATLLAAAKDDSWYELLLIFERLKADDPMTWRSLAVVTLETMATRNACEALGRDPWNSVAPLITRLLQGLADQPPPDPGRAVRAVIALFQALRSADPITWPDGLPGAVAHLARTWVGFGTQLISAFVLALDHSRLPDLLLFKRTSRSELRSLRRIASDLMLIDAIDAALAMPVHSRQTPSSSAP